MAKLSNVQFCKGIVLQSAVKEEYCKVKRWLSSVMLCKGKVRYCKVMAKQGID